MIELINAAITANLQQRVKNESRRSFLDPAIYARECKTVHINIGRQTGKTTAIAQLCRANDLIVFSNTNIADMFRHANNNVSRFATVVTINQLRNMFNTHNLCFDYVWIDEPNMCENKVDTNLIYEYVAADLFVKLGE